MDVKSHKNAVPVTDNPSAVVVREQAAPKRKRLAALGETLFFGALYVAFGALANSAALPFGARPFGIALLCAADRRVFWLYLGLCLSAWQGADRILLIGIYTAILLVRLLTRLTIDAPWSKRERKKLSEKTLPEVYPLLFSEHIALRVCVACVGALAIGLWRLLEGGFLYYDLYGALLSILLSSVSVLLLCGFFTRREVGIYRYMSGWLTFCAIIVFALEGWKLYGVSLSVFGAMFVTLYATRHRGIVLGTLTGTLIGLVISIELAPLFAFAALASGLFFSLSCFLGVASAFAVAAAWGGYVKGIGILDGILTGLLSAAILFSVCDRLFATKQTDESDAASVETEPIPTPCAPLSTAAIDSIRLNDTHHTVKELCESFSSLSDALFSLSRRMQSPTAADLRQICDTTFDSSCVSCSERPICWGERYHDTCAHIGSLCTLLHRQGRADLGELPEELRESCRRLPDILDEINHRAALHQKQILQNDRTEIFAMDYRALSTLLAAAMVRQERAYEVDTALTESLCQALNESALGIREVAVWGERRKTVTVIAHTRETLLRNADAIAETIRKVCPFPIEDGRLAEHGEAVMEFAEAERLSTLCAQRNVCAEHEGNYCGDTADRFYTADGRFCALISDGMGSGREAALTSDICAIFLKKMILSGNSCDASLDMLNGFLRNRGSSSLHECSATIDLMSLDLLHGKASFYKCGAAPTYVFRDGNLFKIRSHTVPLGIIQEPDTRKLDLAVSAGDVVIMVSDGVTQSKEECPWLFDLLRSQGEGASPDRLADLIVKYAKGEGGSDDISVLVIKIVEQEIKE